MYILHLSILLTTRPSTVVYCCQQDPTTVLDSSLLGLTLLPDPMMVGLGAQLKQDPLKLGPASTRTKQRWAQLPTRPTTAGYCCHQDPVALTKSVSFEIWACNWAGGNQSRRVNPNLGDSTKTRQSPLFLIFFPPTQRPFLFHIFQLITNSFQN